MIRHLKSSLLIALLLFSGILPAGEVPLKIVSLSPGLTEIVFKLGGLEALSGRSSACDYPAAVKQLTVAGSVNTPNPERIITLGKVLVLGNQEYLAPEWRQLEKLGVPVELLPERSIADYPGNVRKIGRILGKSAAAEAEICRFKAEINKFSSPTNPRPSALFVLGVAPLVTCGGGTLIDEVLTLSGFRNAGHGKIFGYYVISPEYILKLNPDYIFAPDMAGAAEYIATLPGFQHLQAVKNHRVFTDLPPELLFRCGPRLPEGISLLYNLRQRTVLPSQSGQGK